ncbi:MAG: hypothetical protein ACE5HO_05890 [bacterium]
MKTILLAGALFLFACGTNTKQEGKNESPEVQSGLSAKKLTWQAPQGWVTETPTSSMRMAQYSLPRVDGDPEDASVAVFYFHGQGGSVEANLQRWYGQFVQPDGRSSQVAAEVSKSTVNDLQQTTVDISGTYLFRLTPMAPTSTEKPHFRMLAAVVESSMGPYFVKMVGPEKTIKNWQQSFFEFMKTFKE